MAATGIKFDHKPNVRRDLKEGETKYYIVAYATKHGRVSVFVSGTPWEADDRLVDRMCAVTKRNGTFYLTPGPAFKFQLVSRLTYWLDVLMRLDVRCTLVMP